MLGLRLRIITLSVLLHLAAVSPANAQNIVARQALLAFEPGLVSPFEASFAPRDVVLEIPLRWTQSLRLEQTVSFTHSRETIELTAGSLLPRVVLFHPDGSGLDRVLYCSPRWTTEVLVGSANKVTFTHELMDNDRNVQYCLGDVDGDNRLDHALALSRRLQVTELGTIQPVPFAELLLEPVPPNVGVARLVLKRISGSHSIFAFEIEQGGHTRFFSSFASGRFNIRSHLDICHEDGERGSTDMAGLNIQVVSADEAHEQLTVRVSVNASPDEVVLIPETMERQ